MIYLDYGATGPVREEAMQAMLPYFQFEYGNPGSLHDFGQNSHDAIEYARKQIGKVIHARPREIVFTSSGTEANNMAIVGTAHKLKQYGNHVITSEIEHPSVLSTCQSLEKEGFQVTYLPVDTSGQVSVKDVAAAITKQTILISIMAANNEVGTLQPLAEIAKLIVDQPILLHTDAVQWIGKLPFSVRKIPVDLLSMGSHKMYGPKGVGALYIRQGVKIQPLLYGGGQERNLRSSTLPTPLIVGFGKAAELASQEIEKEKTRLIQLRDTAWRRMKAEIPDVELNGHPEKRLPGNLNLSFHGIEGQAIMLELNREQIYVSSGSACSAGKHQASHVLIAMGKSEEVAYQSVRITMGKDTSKEDMDALIHHFKKITNYFRQLI